MAKKRSSGNDRATKAEAVAAAVQTRRGPKKKRAFRQVRTVHLLYDEEVMAKVSVPLKVLGAHAQAEAGIQQDGKISRAKARYVQPELVYLFDGSKEQLELSFLLLRGDAEIPMDGREYKFLALTADRNPNHNCKATVWLVTGESDDG